MASFFRQLGPDDVAPLTDALVRWHRKEGRPLDPVVTRREVAKVLRDNQEWHLWFIEQNERAVGYLAVQFRPGARLEATRAYIAGLYILPEYRHLNLGRRARQLVQEIGRWLSVQVHDFDTQGEAKHAIALTRHAGVMRAWADDTPLQASA